VQPTFAAQSSRKSWFITGDTNDPNSSAITVKSVGFKSLKDTYQKIGHQCKKASIEVKGVTAKDLYRQAMDENLSSSSGRTATPAWKIGGSGMPLTNQSDNSSARLRQAAQQRVETAYAYGPRISSTTESSKCHWKNDLNTHCRTAGVG
jgi:hypothetical protein